MSSKSNHCLDVAKVMEGFQREEESPTRCKGAFKIDKPFEQILDTILRVKPKAQEPKK